MVRLSDEHDKYAHPRIHTHTHTRTHTHTHGNREQKMVDLSDEHDKAANDEATADLTRNTLGGVLPLLPFLFSFSFFFLSFSQR